MTAKVFLPPGVHPALLGKSFFPCSPDKRPAFRLLPKTPKGDPTWEPFRTRLPAAEEIERWKTHRGPWGMPCGKMAGLVVLDFDVPEGPKLFESRYDEQNLPPTALTPKGGYHAFHALSNGDVIPNDVKLVPGLDVRSDGGYVVIPSDFRDGRTWVRTPDTPAPPLPRWFLELVRKPPAPAAAPSTEPDGLPEGVGKGKRNDTATRYAGRCLARGLSAEETSAILSAWNRKNSPPLPEEEIRRIVFSIAKRERDRTVALEVVDAVDLVSSQSVSQPLLVAPFFPVGGKGILAGNSGTGKTMLAENIAYTLADGKPLFARFDVRQANVLYVDAESTPALTRTRAQRIARGLQSAHRGVAFIFPEKRLDLGVARNREQLCKAIEKHKAGLLILDSFLCFASLRTENDNTEVREWLERLGDIPKATGAALLVLDHSGKNTADKVKAGIGISPRGASAKRDWADLVLMFEERKNELKFMRTLVFDKTRFSAKVPSLILEMDSNFVFLPSGEDEKCPIPIVRQTVEENPGIGATKLYKLLQSLTGCHRQTAEKAAIKAAELGFIVRQERGKYVDYHPIRGSGGSPNPEDEKNEGEFPFVYQ